MAINVAIYNPGEKRWAMTERGRRAVLRDAETLRIGPSMLAWHDDRLTIEFDEIAVPRPPAELRPKRLKGRVIFRPDHVTGEVFDIDGDGAHRWWPIAPGGRITVEMADGLGWSGHGYLDSNWGALPLQRSFAHWNWARAALPDGRSVILYDTATKKNENIRLSLSVDRGGTISLIDVPPLRQLERGFWGVGRSIRADVGTAPRLIRTLEDGPFYVRSLVETTIGGERMVFFHEAVSGTRFSNPLVRAMLPFRMPRRARF